MGLPGNKLSPLIPFDLIVDIDFGLIRMINERYHNKDTFHSSLLSMPDKNLIYLLFERDHINPLSVVMKDTSNEEIMNSYYNEFIDTEYASILKHSCTTNIYTLVKLSCNTDGAIRPNILCKSELEKEFLLKIDSDTFSKCNIVIGYLPSIPIKAYDIIYIKYYVDAIKAYKMMYGKNLYVAGYGFNMEVIEGNKILNHKLDVVLGSKNRITIMTIYNIDDTYKAKG